MLSDEGVPWRRRLAGIFSTSGAAPKPPASRRRHKNLLSYFVRFSGFSRNDP